MVKIIPWVSKGLDKWLFFKCPNHDKNLQGIQTGKHWVIKEKNKNPKMDSEEIQLCELPGKDF